MHKRILKDLERFKRIVRGEIRKNLKDLIESDAIIGQKGGDVVKIPVKSIRIPQFRYDPRDAGGIGAGEGEIGEPIKPGDQPGLSNHAGEGPGAHFPEVEIELRELAEILGEELELPHIQPKGEQRIIRGDDDYTDVSVQGPESLLMKKRSFRQGLMRQMLLSDPNRPNPSPSLVDAQPMVVTPIKEDKRYLYGEPQEAPEANCLIVFMRDASGSMSGEKTEIIRQENWWIDLWLRTNYENVERVYIIHDYEAHEVNEEEFYALSTGGGTRISAAYELCDKIIDRRFPTEQWNIYPFHFSDGENWIGDTENVCVPLLRDRLLAKVNLFAYGQVALGRRSPGMHLIKLKEVLTDRDNLTTSIISGREDILASIKEFLGTGR
ncbi:DUF444 family protein [Candidatus Acetothermia bacterium]|nr:DUF444 family protein [Candidatus Acetothermia bacterium]